MKPTNRELIQSAREQLDAVEASTVNDLWDATHMIGNLAVAISKLADVVENLLDTSERDKVQA